MERLTRREFFKTFIPASLLSQENPHPRSLENDRTTFHELTTDEWHTLVGTMSGLVHVASNHNDRLIDLETRFPKMAPINPSEGEL